jgi:hypothetical protein
MKSPLPLLALAALCLFQVGCAVYDEDAYEDAYDDDPNYVVGSPAIMPVVAWGGPGYYGGSYYRSSSAYYGSSYYRRGSGSGAAYRTPWSNGGYYNGARVDANWRNGSGDLETRRGGSASWDNGSGSAHGWRGGSASWGGGSGSWEGSRGRSGSWRR